MSMENSDGGAASPETSSDSYGSTITKVSYTISVATRLLVLILLYNRPPSLSLYFFLEPRWR
jgi:hypothetical protein